ncbi:MAG: histidinol-phosphate transaminase [Paludibacter sp.]|nr:histidinol-phosphate transaminase [Paludibacter sp.]
MMNINELLRENVKNMQPYSCARDEFKGEASVYLDANESPYNSPYNRYPDPQQWKVKEAISKIKNVPAANIFIGNGSDEPIDLLFRAFCEPRKDNVVAIEPTYGMYKVCAAVNDIEYRKVALNDAFDIEAFKLMDATNHSTKIIWLCSPNNPTGNSLNILEIEKLLQWFRGIVVVDEAYIDFSTNESLSSLLENYANLVILQTMSKAWGNAGIRLGMAYASTEIIEVLNKIKYPYNINILTQEHALKMLSNKATVDKWVETILDERTNLIKKLKALDLVKHIYPTDANFVLVKVEDATMVYNWLVNKGIIVRNRSSVTLCDNCLRITVGEASETKSLISALNEYATVLK